MWGCVKNTGHRGALTPPRTGPAAGAATSRNQYRRRADLRSKGHRWSLSVTAGHPSTAHRRPGGAIADLFVPKQPTSCPRQAVSEREAVCSHGSREGGRAGGRTGDNRDRPRDLSPHYRDALGPAWGTSGPYRDILDHYRGGLDPFGGDLDCRGHVLADPETSRPRSGTISLLVNPRTGPQRSHLRIGSMDHGWVKAAGVGQRSVNDDQPRLRPGDRPLRSDADRCCSSLLVSAGDVRRRTLVATLEGTAPAPDGPGSVRDGRADGPRPSAPPVESMGNPP